MQLHWSKYVQLHWSKYFLPPWTFKGMVLGECPYFQKVFFFKFLKTPQTSCRFGKRYVFAHNSGFFQFSVFLIKRLDLHKLPLTLLHHACQNYYYTERPEMRNTCCKFHFSTPIPHPSLIFLNFRRYSEIFGNIPGISVPFDLSLGI